MNRFLLLALTAGFFSPIAVKAESIWLILNTVSLEKIEMESMEQCEEMGKYWQERHYPKFKSEKWACMKGK